MKYSGHISIINRLNNYYRADIISDLKNIAKIKEGDEKAFSNLFRDYYKQLYLFAVRFVKDPSVAENIVQDVFVILWEQRNKIIISTNVKAYLYTSVRNHSLNYVKRESRLLTLDEQLEIVKNLQDSPEEIFIKNETYIAVHKAIDELPEKCRRVYQMKKYDDLSYEEIAEILCISVNTVKTQMKRAVKKLKEKLSVLNFMILFIKF